MKLERVTKIELVFLNCEELMIPMKDIVFFELDNITERIICQNILRNDTHEIYRYKTAREVILRFKNKPKYHRVFKSNDITQIHLYDELGNHEWFCVLFSDEFYNDYQKTEIEDDEIVITIMKTSEE